jgi:phenylalanyl-tRNA synthetase beta chain
LEKLADRQIIVRHAKDREKLPALDEKTYELKSEDLVIADAEKAVAIAGIMGGQETGVTAATKHILLESAVFDPGRVRATSRRLALKSESSARFEKGTDAETAALVSLRAASLMLELAGGQPGRETDAYPKKTKPTAITLKASRVNDVIGLSIAPKRVETVLKSQGYAVKAAKGAWTCTVPAHRKDIAYDVDVIEDVIRLIGYDAVPETLPPLALNTLPAHFRSLPVAGLTDILKGAGLNETMSSSFCSLVFAEKLGFKREALVPLLNPLSQEESFLRPALSTTLLGAVMRNINFQRDSVALFEIGRTYHAAADYPRETRTLGIALYGSLREKSVHDAEKNYSFFEIKGLLELIRERLGRPLAFKEGSSVSFLHPHQSVEILCEGKPAGWAGLVHPSLSTEWGFTRPCALAEINLELLLARISGTTQAKALPKYPAVQRDIAIVVDKASAWGQLEKTVREAGGTLVKSIRPFDVFAGGQLEASKKSVAFRITLQHEEHTLSDTEITSVVDKIKTSLRDRCGAQLR